MGEQRQAAQPHPDCARAAHRPPGLLRRPLLAHDTLFHNTLLSAVRRLDPGSASHELQREFCLLWSQLIGSMLDVRQDPALQSNAMCILSLMHTLYDSLHEVTGSRWVAFMETMDGLELSLQSQPLTCFLPTLPIVSLLGVLAESSVFMRLRT